MRCDLSAASSEVSKNQVALEITPPFCCGLNRTQVLLVVRGLTLVLMMTSCRDLASPTTRHCKVELYSQGGMEFIVLTNRTPEIL